ncbi:DUF2550 domain-containing protein [Marmoricola endophyticus]|uniref:DUF2550 domain-containing protein n=1 Tax=Marmoricola endophyticus TaxID=2040280 RepID=UPI00166BE8B4|nr:DUF2550 domain-containing protein [Marmoricola endophyticus]
MAPWLWVLDSAAVVLIVVLLYGITLVLRRRLLSRHGGTFELSVRTGAGDAGRGWVLGLGRYDGGRLEWFRIFSLLPAAKRTWDRDDLSYRSSRPPEGDERLTLYDGHLVVICDSPGGEVQMAMASEALTGLQAWLEAGPPGAQWPSAR